LRSEVSACADPFTMPTIDVVVCTQFFASEFLDRSAVADDVRASFGEGGREPVGRGEKEEVIVLPPC